MTVTTPTLSMLVDTDGQFNTEIISDVISVEWGLGTRPGQFIAEPINATITLNNLSNQYSPEHASALSGLTIHKPVKLIASGVELILTDDNGHFLIDDNGAYLHDGVQPATVLFNLWVSAITPIPNTAGKDKTSVIECEGYLAEASRHTSTSAVQLNKTYDVLITALLDDSGLFPPGGTGTWKAGSSIWGVSTRLSGASFGSDLEAGSFTFPVAFHNNPQRATLYDLLRVVIENEQGKLYTKRDGGLRGLDRNGLTDALTVGFEIADGSGAPAVGMAYRYGTDIRNLMNVTISPTTTTATIATVGTYDAVIAVKPTESRDIGIYYKDSNSNPISTSSLITPVAVTDFTANTVEDGTGADISQNVSATATNAGDRAIVTYTNNGGATAYIQAGAQVRGNNTITALNESTFDVKEQTSIDTYGTKPYPLNLSFIDDRDYAANVAQWYFVLYKDPRGQVPEIRIYPGDSLPARTIALAGVLEKRINIIEGQTGLSAESYAVGERWSISKNLSQWEYTIILDNTKVVRFWKAGVSTWGTTTRLGL